MFGLIKESLADFHLSSFLIDEVQVGSVDSVSKLWEGIFTTFKILEKNAFDTTVTKNVFNEIRKDTIALFNEDKTPAL